MINLDRLIENVEVYFNILREYQLEEGSPSSGKLHPLAKNTRFIEIFFESKCGKRLNDKSLLGLLGKFCGKHFLRTRRKKIFTKKDISEILYKNNLVEGETNEKEINKFLFTTKFEGRETYVFRRYGEQDYILQAYKPYVPVPSWYDESGGDIFG